MDLDEFRKINAKAPPTELERPRRIIVRELASSIHLEARIPVPGFTRAKCTKAIYGDIDVGDCHMGLLLAGDYLWGAYRCSGACEFVGAWCWLMLLPWTFGQYSADARAVYHRMGDNVGWKACAHHSLPLDVAVYTFWKACIATA